MAKLRRKKRGKKEQGSHSVLISRLIFSSFKSVDLYTVYRYERLIRIIKYRLRLIFIKLLSIYEQFKLDESLYR